MIEKKKVTELVLSRIDGSDIFLVDILVGKSNEVRVLLDSFDGVSIEQCVEISRWLSSELEATEENFSLEVSSPGLGEPLAVAQQYHKNIGRDIEVVMTDGKKKKGKLLGVTDDAINLEVKEKQLAGGSQKKKKDVLVSRTYPFEEIKSTKVVISF